MNLRENLDSVLETMRLTLDDVLCARIEHERSPASGNMEELEAFYADPLGWKADEKGTITLERGGNITAFLEAIQKLDSDTNHGRGYVWMKDGSWMEYTMYECAAGYGLIPYRCPEIPKELLD